MLGSKCCCTNYRCDDLISGTEGIYEFKIDTDGGTNNFGPRQINISYQSGNGEEVYGASIAFSLYNEENNELLFSTTISDIGQYPKVYTESVSNIPETGTILLRVNATLPSDYDGFAPAIKWHFYVTCRGYLPSYCLSGADYVTDDNGQYIATNAPPETVTVTLQAEDYSITVPRIGYKRRKWKYTDWDLIPENLRGKEIGWQYALLDMGWNEFSWEKAIRLHDPECTNLRWCGWDYEWGKLYEWADEEEVYEYESKTTLPGSAYSGTFELSKIAAYNDGGEFINYYWQYTFGDAFPYGEYTYYWAAGDEGWTNPPAALTFNPFNVPSHYMETSIERAPFSFSNAEWAPGYLDRMTCSIKLTNVKRHWYLWKKGEEDDCVVTMSINPDNLYANACCSHSYYWTQLYSIDPVNNKPEFEDVVEDTNNIPGYVYPYYGNIPINRDLGKGAPITVLYGWYTYDNNINRSSIWHPEWEADGLIIGEFTEEYIGDYKCGQKIPASFPIPSKIEIGESHVFGHAPMLGPMVTWHPGYDRTHNEQYPDNPFGFGLYGSIPWMGGFLTEPSALDWTPRIVPDFSYVINRVEPFNISNILGFSSSVGGWHGGVTVPGSSWNNWIRDIGSDGYPCAFPAKAFLVTTYLPEPPDPPRGEPARVCTAAFIINQYVNPGNTYKSMIQEEGDPRIFLERVDVTFEDLGGEDEQ